MIEVFATGITGLGVLFFLGTVVGVMRFPDFYTRMHSAAKGDTLSTFLILSGVALYFISYYDGVSILLGVKVLFISFFLCITGPAAAHVLVDAGYEAGLVPWTKDPLEERGADDGNN